MPHEIPPVIEPPKTLIGVGVRELVILSLFGLVAISIFLLSLSLPLRIGLAVFVALAGLLAAFGRDARSGKPIEVLLSDRLRFSSRTRFWQRGARWVEESRVPPKPEGDQEGSGRVLSHPRITVQALPVTGLTWLSAASLAMLTSLLAWAWLGGVREIWVWLGPGLGR